MKLVEALVQLGFVLVCRFERLYGGNEVRHFQYSGLCELDSLWSRIHLNGIDL